jgi:hypothetical protein
MKFWLIRLKDPCWNDNDIEVAVVSAENESRAREIASTQVTEDSDAESDSREKILDPLKSDCETI